MVKKCYALRALRYCYYDGENLEPVKEYIAEMTKDDGDHPSMELEYTDDGRLRFCSINEYTGDWWCPLLPPNTYIVDGQLLTPQEFFGYYLTEDPRKPLKLGEDC